MQKLVLIFLFLVPLSLLSQTKKAAKYYPTIEGEVFEGKKKIKDVEVKVFAGDSLVSKTKSDSTGTYKLFLGIDTIYTIHLVKENFTSKKYEVNTKDLTDERIYKPLNTINAQTEMHQMLEGVDYSAYNKSVVKFFYNKKTDKFEIDNKHFSKSFKEQKKISEKEKKLALQQKQKKK